MKNKSVAYGSLYLDKLEGWEKVTEQIDFFAKKEKKEGVKIVAFFFDVLGWENQREEGEKMVKRILKYAKKTFPNLNICKCSFSVNQDIKDMPKN